MFISDDLVEGNIYTRKELRQQYNIKDANFNNGVFRLAGYQTIWLFVTEKKASDRPQLSDLLEQDILHWDGQPLGRTDKLIIEHQKNSYELLVFYRKNTRQFSGAGFKYEGRFQYKSHAGSQPTHFILLKVDNLLLTVKEDIEAIKVEETYYKEGKASSKLVNTHERNPKLRTAAIKIHGVRCQVCNFSFQETYGEHGENFIEIHHRFPVSNYNGEVQVNPDKDMASLCANCHRMIHRHPDRPLDIEELRNIVQANKTK